MRYLLGMVFLVGCVETDARPAAPNPHPRTVIIDNGGMGLYVTRFTDTLPDGGIVYCYTSKAGYSGGISCMRKVPVTTPLTSDTAP